MLFCLTGTPGTGKSTLSAELRSRGYRVVDGKEYIKEHGLLGEYDTARDTYEVDLEELNGSLDELRNSNGIVILDSHLSHFMDSSGIIVLRCHPDALAGRLASRGYSESKIAENVQAEILDEILCEAAESDIPVGEIDTTDLSVRQIADITEKIISEGPEDYLPGSTDWSSEMDRWF